MGSCVKYSQTGAQTILDPAMTAGGFAGKDAYAKFAETEFASNRSHITNIKCASDFYAVQRIQEQRNKRP